MARPRGRREAVKGGNQRLFDRLPPVARIGVDWLIAQVKEQGNAMSDTQRTAIVTGAAGGIGRALVEGLLAAGIRVAAVDRTADGLAQLSANARQQNNEAALLTIEADLSRDAASADIVVKTRGHFGKIDILVNNAGIGQATLRAENWQRPIRFWEITADDWRRFVAVHTTAPLLLAQAVLPEMRQAGWGRIVNVTTKLDTMNRVGTHPYGTSKAALEMATEVWAKDVEGPASRSTSSERLQHSTNGLKPRKARGTCRTR